MRNHMHKNIHIVIKICNICIIVTIIICIIIHILS